MFRVTVAAALILVAALSATVPSAQSPDSDGKQIFRYDTFGDEQLWTDRLQMQHAVEQLSPAAALAAGLKVDSDALPASIIDAIRAGLVDLDDPAVTIQLLKLNAVVGVIGKVVGANDQLATVGITCALCHSTVDNSIAAGIGRRLDGWANTTLNVGAVIALSPQLPDSPYDGWGPGMFDPRFRAFDGANLITLNTQSEPAVIPPVYGLQGVGFETFTADGPISYWNNYVGVSQMGGHGSFSDPRIPLLITQTPDLVTPKLVALRDYQLTLTTPAPPAGSFDRAAARRGNQLFMSTARCATCHVPPTYTDVLSGPVPTLPLLHAAEEVGTDGVYASRSVTRSYRTTPLRGLWQHPPYFHDGSAKDLMAVVNHYDAQFSLHLSDRQKTDLVEFLKSL